MSEKIRENRLRRMAYRQGYHLVKCRLRDVNAVGFGCYELYPSQGDEYPGEYHIDYPFFGSGPTGQPKATLDEIEEFLNEKGPVYQAHFNALAKKIGLGAKPRPRRKMTTEQHVVRMAKERGLKLSKHRTKPGCYGLVDPNAEDSKQRFIFDKEFLSLEEIELFLVGTEPPYVPAPKH